jgi:DNA-binding NtrC family response regulator
MHTIQTPEERIMSTLCVKPVFRTAVLASSDVSFRRRVRETLTGLRWQVREATGGAEALAELDAIPTEALILDSWLPDLAMDEFVAEFRRQHPAVDLVTVDGSEEEGSPVKSPRRHELLYAIRRGQDADGAIWNSAPVIEQISSARSGLPCVEQPGSRVTSIRRTASNSTEAQKESIPSGALNQRLPELIGNHRAMLEVSRRVRLVAPRRTPVLIEGATGTGKELVARALHRMSDRSGRPFVALNCAAIPESLLESELFGHTRGAFTGAVQGRTGRIEAAHGGTLFLDEIGEMPLSLQSKLLRFVECGELQRVGENEPVRVDVRVLAATHQPLAKLAASGEFRSDLYYRLAVFVVRTPALREHLEDLPLLIQHFMAKLAQEAPAKRIGTSAMERLTAHGWPGNVRELEHVLECATILAEERAEITADEIEFGFSPESL